jgi:hypothetical protein
MEEMNITDYEANLEEIEAVPECREVPNEEATVETVSAVKDRHGDQWLAVR